MYILNRELIAAFPRHSMTLLPRTYQLIPFERERDIERERERILGTTRFGNRRFYSYHSSCFCHSGKFDLSAVEIRDRQTGTGRETGRETERENSGHHKIR